jgi:cellulose synthase/poly-beta-1,6-N-acetylglucosamine synthase-like glycosyltransferase
MAWYEIFIVGLYLAIMLMLFIYSMGQLHLTFAYLKARKKGKTKTPEIKNYPLVTVQLPIFNEEYVIERLIDSVSKLDYPEGKLEIQVLDDSTDDSVLLAQQKVKEHQKRGINIKYIRRNERSGFKAGALAYGLKEAAGEFIAIFDADFLPPTDFLLKTIPHFENSDIGVVQTRWGHINKEYSLFTRIQSFALNAHFSIEQTGRNYSKSFINFNGTAGVWRKSCIEDAGGWSAETLTEDLDLSYRAQIKGWEFKYLEEVESPAELPVLMPAIKSQQYRWNKGAAETAVKNLRKVFNTSLPLKTKIHATFHLLNSSIFVLLLFGGVISLPVLYIKYLHPEVDFFFHLASILLFGFMSIGFFFWVSEKKAPYTKSKDKFIPSFFTFMTISMGLSFHNAVAVLEGLFGKKTPFIRTPKFNSTSDNALISGNKYLTEKVDFNTIIELILGIYFLGGIVLGLYINDIGLLVFHAMLAIGLLTVSYQSIKGARYA